MPFGEVPFPATPHAEVILAEAWSIQSVMAWSTLSAELQAFATELRGQMSLQHDISSALSGMSGAYIRSVSSLAQIRETALMNRIMFYQKASQQAQNVAGTLFDTKLELVEVVRAAETQILQATQAANQAAARGNPIPLAELEAKTATIVAEATARAISVDAEGAAKAGTSLADLQGWTEPYQPTAYVPPTTPATPTSPEAPTSPAAPGLDPGTARGQAVDRFDALERADLEQPSPSETAQEQQQLSMLRSPEASQEPTAAERETHSPSTTSSPSTSTSPSSPSGSPSNSSGSPASGLSQMMKMNPSSSSSSPASSSSPGSSTGSSTGANPGSAASANPASGKPAAMPAAAQAPGPSIPPAKVSGAGMLSGLGESASRIGTGAVNTAANVAGNVSGAAQSVASASSGVASAPAATTAAASPAPMGGVPPVMSPGPGPGGPGPTPHPTPTPGPTPGPGPSAATTSGPPASTVPASNHPTASPSPSPSSSQAGQDPAMLMPVPLLLPMSPLAHLDPSADSRLLMNQATEAGRSVIETMVAQSRATGYMGISWAASLVWERTGEVTAWLASSEGPSYVPLGVRVPDGVGMAVTDRVAGPTLAEWSAAGVSPLEVLTRHFDLRDAANPGGRMLVLAGSDPADRISGWASTVGARSVAVEAALVEPARFDGEGQHRCQAAMPWEWRQAAAFTEDGRLQVADRHMRMAAVSSHLTAPACAEVMRLFEMQKPISDTQWTAVLQEWNDAVVNYQLSQTTVGMGGSDPGRAFMIARAAELILCLKDAATAEGCADILYLARLAGAPLKPLAAAV